MLDYNGHDVEVFGFTDCVEPPHSQIVQAAFYDARTKELLVSLYDNGDYLYYNVPVSTWVEFKNAESKGSFYNKTIKRLHGPGAFFDYVLLEPIEDEAVKGTPKGLTYAEDAVVDGEPLGGEPMRSLDDAHPAADRVTLVGPYGAAPAAHSNTVVLNITNEPRRHRTEVFFEANGAEKSHTLYVHDSTEAVEAVEQIGAMLDVDLNIKRVVVYFE